MADGAGEDDLSKRLKDFEKKLGDAKDGNEAIATELKGFEDLLKWPCGVQLEPTGQHVRTVLHRAFLRTNIVSSYGHRHIQHVF